MQRGRLTDAVGGRTYVHGMGIHPWRRFRSHTAFRLVHHDGGDPGFTDFDAFEVSLRRDLDWAERRSTILHECLHVERGPVPDGLYAKEEIRVRKLAATALLPCVVEVGDALVWGQGHVEPAAAELNVDVATLTDRLRHCTPRERAYLLDRLREEAPAP